MGIARRHIEAVDLIITVWDGVIDPAAWSRAVDGEVAAPASAQANRRLTDARTADSSAVTYADVEAMAANLSGLSVDLTRVRLAIVATTGWQTAQHFEVSMRKYGVTTVVFTDIHTACAWLGVDAPFTLAIVDEMREELRDDGVPRPI